MIGLYAYAHLTDNMVDIPTAYQIVGIAVGLITITGAIWKLRQWRENRSGSPPKDGLDADGHEEKLAEQIACNNCQRIFTPKWKRKSGFLGDEEYALCPHCGEENAFDVEEDEEESFEDEDELEQ